MRKRIDGMPCKDYGIEYSMQPMAVLGEEKVQAETKKAPIDGAFLEPIDKTD